MKELQEWQNSTKFDPTDKNSLRKALKDTFQFEDSQNSGKFPQDNLTFGIDNDTIPKISELRENWHISRKGCSKIRQVKKIFFKTIDKAPVTTSDLNIVLKWSDDLKSYDIKDFKLYKSELHKKNKFHLRDMTAFID
jgi:hypothetical protein